MGEPTFPQVLRSAIPQPLQVAFSGEPYNGLNQRVNRLKEEIGALQDSVAEQKKIMWVFMDLAFVADWPKLLRACGIEDFHKLSGQDVKELHERMERENKKRRFMGSVPSVEQLESLAQAARLAAECGPSGGHSGAADS